MARIRSVSGHQVHHAVVLRCIPVSRVCHLFQFSQRHEDVCHQDLIPIGTVKSLDIRVLCQLAWLDELRFDLAHLCPAG